MGAPGPSRGPPAHATGRCAWRAACAGGPGGGPLAVAEARWRWGWWGHAGGGGPLAVAVEAPAPSSARRESVWLGPGQLQEPAAGPAVVLCVTRWEGARVERELGRCVAEGMRRRAGEQPWSVRSRSRVKIADLPLPPLPVTPRRLPLGAVRRRRLNLANWGPKLSSSPQTSPQTTSPQQHPGFDSNDFASKFTSVRVHTLETLYRFSRPYTFHDFWGRMLSPPWPPMAPAPLRLLPSRCGRCRRLLFAAAAAAASSAAGPSAAAAVPGQGGGPGRAR